LETVGSTFAAPPSFEAVAAGVSSPHTDAPVSGNAAEKTTERQRSFEMVRFMVLPELMNGLKLFDWWSVRKQAVRIAPRLMSKFLTGST
jgi:hypothetical protein